jgi:hypothetical protein
MFALKANTQFDEKKQMTHGTTVVVRRHRRAFVAMSRNVDQTVAPSTIGRGREAANAVVADGGQKR